MKKFSLSRLLLIVVCLLFLCGSGCNRNTIPGLVRAEGVLVYEDAPLPWAVVSIVPKTAGPGSRPASALTNANGRFALRTLGQNGAQPGEYFVSVRKYILDEGPNTVANWKKDRQEGIPEPKPEDRIGDDVPDIVSAIPDKFDNPRHSGIEITVGPRGERNLKIELND